MFKKMRALFSKSRKNSVPSLYKKSVYPPYIPTNPVKSNPITGFPVVQNSCVSSHRALSLHKFGRTSVGKGQFEVFTCKPELVNYDTSGSTNPVTFDKDSQMSISEIVAASLCFFGKERILFYCANLKYVEQVVNSFKEFGRNPVWLKCNGKDTKDSLRKWDTGEIDVLVCTVPCKFTKCIPNVTSIVNFSKFISCRACLYIFEMYDQHKKDVRVLDFAEYSYPQTTNWAVCT
jgi:hypothetical protein